MERLVDDCAVLDFDHHFSVFFTFINVILRVLLCIPHIDQVPGLTMMLEVRVQDWGSIAVLSDQLKSHHDVVFIDDLNGHEIECLRFLRVGEDEIIDIELLATIITAAVATLICHEPRAYVYHVAAFLAL